MDDHIVFLELRLADGPAAPADLAAATPLSVQRVRQALQRLLRMGLVQCDAEADTWTIAS